MVFLVGLSHCSTWHFMCSQFTEQESGARSQWKAAAMLGGWVLLPALLVAAELCSLRSVTAPWALHFAICGKENRTSTMSSLGYTQSGLASWA